MAYLEPDLLKTFVAICETGSFRAAATRVHRTPGAVSMQMRKLEEAVCCPLFAKEGRNVRVTRAGEALLGDARRLLAANAEVMERFRRPQAEGRLRFGAPDDYGTRWLPGILARFAERAPAVEVEVALGPSSLLAERLERGDLDLALLTDCADYRDRFAGEVIHREPLAWFGAVGGIAHMRAPLPLALAGDSCHWRRSATDALDRAGIAHRALFVSEHSAGQIAAVRADLAVAPLPVSCAQGAIERLGPDVLPVLPDYEVRLALGPDAGTLAREMAGDVRALVMGRGGTGMARAAA